jgi:hypothetical protein
MQKVYTRSRAEQELVHALTRQIGYTTGAFSIKRMAGIVNEFRQASAYQFELVKALLARASSDSISEKYATEILNFAGELGIISKMAGTAAAHLSKYVLTDAGVALRASRAGYGRLETLVLEHLILENDADAYLTVLSAIAEDPDRSAADLAALFTEEVKLMRAKRLAWLETAFPTRAVLTRLLKDGAKSRVHWLKLDRLQRIEADEPGADFGRHHATPRKTWTVELGHCRSDSGCIAESGSDLLRRVQWPGRGGDSWIAPSPECLAFLKARPTQSLRGASAPTLDLLRIDADTKPPSDEIVAKAATFLRNTFEEIRLVHAHQAPTAALRYFAVLLEHEHSQRISVDEMLVLLAKQYAQDFAFLSSRMGPFAYYQLRERHG